MRRSDIVRAGVAALFACPAGPARAAFERAPLDAASAGLGGVSVTSPDGAFGNTGRLAAAASPKRQVSFQASRPFGWAELTEVQAAYAQPGSGVGWALGARRFGGVGYAETELRAAAVHRRGPASVGLAARGLEASGAGIAPVRSVALDASLLLHANGPFEAGASLEAIAGDIPGDVQAKRRRVAIGVSALVGAIARVHVEARRRGVEPVSAAAGLSLEPVPALVFRMGAANDPAEVTWGFSLARQPAAVDVAVQHHESLGRTVRVGFRLESPGPAP